MLSWNEYVQQGIVRRTTPNIGVIRTLVEIAKNRISMISKISVDEKNSSVLFTNYYDALREICEALAISKGYKIYQHEAVGLFLREELKEDAIFMKFDKFRQLRNGVNYYGRPVNVDEAKQAIEDINGVVEKLKSRYLKEFN